MEMICFCGAPLKEVGHEIYSGCEAGHDILEVFKGLLEKGCREAGCTVVGECPLDNNGECVLEEDLCM